MLLVVYFVRKRENQITIEMTLYYYKINVNNKIEIV